MYALSLFFSSDFFYSCIIILKTVSLVAPINSLLFSLLSRILFYRYGTIHFYIQILMHMEKAMAPHSSTFAWKIPWTEESGRLQSMGSLESDTTERLHFHFSLSCIGEGNGNPLQCSWLENPKDGEAWWAAVLWGRTELDTTEAT